MKAAERRQKIMASLSQAQVPISASALASQFGVSRQIIVGDIALLRAADSDVITYRTSTKGGELFLDIKQDLSGQEYLKITQSKHQGNKGFHRETIFINKDEILQFKQELDRAIEYWGLNPIKQKQTLSFKREEYGNAYLPWEKSADDYLLRLYAEGKTINELTEIFERNDGAIRSRLQKLGIKLR